MMTLTEYREKMGTIADLYKAGEIKFEDSDLTYAAMARCPCGAGLAHVKNPRNLGMEFWDCSACLKGEAIPKGQEGSVEHTALRPFVFWEIKSENQPSAAGMTTRPKAQTR
jgi:hypothetical protein